MAAGRRGRAGAAGSAQRDPYAVVTAQIVDALERGTVPWRTPWATARGSHRNGISGRAYRGINTLVLAMRALEEGWSDPRWMTFKQAKAAGGSVRKGSQGTRVILWKWVDRPTGETDDEGRELTERRPFTRIYSVFNVAQVDGVELPEQADVAGERVVSVNEAADEAIAAYLGAGGPTLHHGAESAYYVPERDEVHVPARETFGDDHGYYSTVLHELAHSTGHPSRLGREGYRTAARFGSERYSQEELVAEMAAAFCGAELGVDPSRLEQSAAYIASWLRVLDDDRRMVVVAAQQGQKAADLLLGRTVATGSADSIAAAALHGSAAFAPNVPEQGTLWGSAA